MDLKFAPADADAIPLYLLEVEAFDGWLARQSAPAKAWVLQSGFAAALGEALTVPATDGSMLCAIAGYGTASARKRARFGLAGAAAKLPRGTYKLVSDLAGAQLEAEALGWLLGQYIFDRYAEAKAPAAQLVAPGGVDAARIEAIAKGEALTRDLINTPANDMGPVALEAAASALAQAHGAQFHVIRGEALLDENFPLIHTVGRASDQAPRLIDMRWGEIGPKLTLVGKGVCFDTGGLNLKPGASMALMKKDMGGAATVMGLAEMIMALGMKVQLRVLIPAVENAVSSNAFRPGDILTSRQGLTVEINNTDAEGRLVLADALSFGAEDTPDMMISMATLTGAARVAVGPDLAPYFSDDSAFVSALEAGAARAQDPVWRLPFWEPYEAMIEPGIADLDNAPSGGFAGCITAALFLRRFAGETNYAHFDVYGWNPAAKPARPKGGVGMAARALLEALPVMLKL